MKVSYNWLSEYLPRPVPIEKLSKILTRIGLEVEAIEKSEAVPGGLEGLVIGEVRSCVAHPNADRLKITTVDIGGMEHLPIVCGAPNVATGQKVVVATVGTMVHLKSGEAFKIKKAKIRGEVSEGMICAEDEIGLGDSHTGILVLPADAPVGQKARDYFKIPKADYIIHIGLTPNRSDANSHIGVAKDICAYLSYHAEKPEQVIFPEVKPLQKEDADLPFQIEVKDEKACPRYAGITVAGVKVAPSPDWLQKRLLSVGIHPVNNVVDITNYVLQEFGQPLHAFDYDKISGKKIIVRKALEGEQFITLDDRERKLTAGDLLICDAEKAMCLAGIFGGLHFGITSATVNVFLESAYFDPRTIRRSSVHHDLRTEAATHFEKGVAMAGVLPALQHAAQLLLEIAGGTVASTITDYYPHPFPPRQITLKLDYLAKLCGKKFQASPVKTLFTALGFSVREEEAGSLNVNIPGENRDIHQAADLVEEVLRIDGLDNIEIPSRLNITLKTKAPAPGRQIKEKMAQYLAYAGLQEIITNSITNSKYYPGQDNIVHLINSLSVELDIMRPTMLESGLEVIAYNANRKMQDLKLFELGKTYLQKAEGDYQETEWLAIWLSGNSAGQHWQHKAEKADIFYLKGLIENIFRLCGLSKVKGIAEDSGLSWKNGKAIIASMKEVAPARLKDFDIRQNVFYAEINIGECTKALNKENTRYRELPKYPAMKRDLALVLEQSIPYENVAAIAKKQSWEALKDFELFDVFENEKLGKDKKSLALSFTFQLNDRTLTDEEVDKMMRHLITTYEQELNATVRS